MENTSHVNSHIKIPSRGCQWMKYIEILWKSNFYGATSGTRTHDLPLTMGMLYKLSYGGVSKK